MNNIIKWNCRDIRANFNDFRLLCDNPIVCCLQETMLTMDYFVIRGFNCIHLTSRDIGGGACGGVSVLVRDVIPCSECKLNTTLQSKPVTISTSKTITICSLYLPPNEILNIVLVTRLITQLPTPFVVCGDFNGHSMTWVVTTTIVREIELMTLLLITMYVYLMMVRIHICTQL